LEKIFLVVAFLETAFLGKKIPWSVVQPNLTRGVSWSRVIRFSNLDFSIGFPNFFKLSPKMLNLGPIYPRKVGHIAIYNFLTPLD
jgi:hypothetical protein